MEEKLIKDRLFLKKVADSYVLHRIKDSILTIEGDSQYTIGGIDPFYKLSLKNCQAIENGYDLDELAEKHYNGHIKRGHTEEDSLQRKIDFTIGFVSALEILGDKKFSEKDLRTAYGVGYLMKINPSDEYHETLNGLVQLLQQTEWDVEIEMICPHPMDTYRCGLQYGCDGDGCNHPEQVPYLDQEGNLILKRK